jgi:hypothetical protein
MESKDVTSFVNPTLDLEQRKAVPELGIEMTSSSSENANESAGEGKGEEKGEEQGEEQGSNAEEAEGGEEVIVTLGANPVHATRGGAATTPPATAPATAPATTTPNAARARWNKLKHATRTSGRFRNGGKKRMKRLSKVMKARQNESGDGGDSMDAEVKTVVDVKAAVSMHVDEETGHRYSYNEATGHTQWFSDDDDGSEVPQENVGESKQQTTTMFRKFVDDDGNVYYENMETEEVVWDLPEDGELAEL